MRGAPAGHRAGQPEHAQRQAARRRRARRRPQRAVGDLERQRPVRHRLAGTRALEQRLEAAWPEQLGFTSTTIIRTKPQLLRLVEENPFGDREDSPSARLNVTFLQRGPKKGHTPPPTPEGRGYEVVAVTDGAVCTAVDLSGSTTPDVMRWLESVYGTAITTRTWKTVHRIAAKL